MGKLEINRVYRHYKGNYYFVKETAISSETLEECVVYQALYGEYKTFVRPLEMFLERIDKDNEDNITKQEYRFELVDLEKVKL